MQQLATDREEIKTSRHGKPWTLGDVEELCRLEMEGCGEEWIAAKLGRSVAAIRHQCNQLGLREPTYRVTCGPVAPMAHVVSTYFSVSIHDMCGLKRDRHIMRARHVAMWLAIRMGRGYSRTARFFHRDHTTTIHAEKKIEGLRQSDPALRELTDALLATCRENAPAPPPAAVYTPKPSPTKKTKTPARRDPDGLDAAFYEGRDGQRDFLEKQEARFRAAMLASGECP